MPCTILFLNDLWLKLSFEKQQDYLFQVQQIYRQQGWWSEKLDTIENLIKIISGSHCFVVAAAESGDVLGMGRAISDRISDAYIQDVAVKSGARGQKIGHFIVKAISDRLERDGMTWIGLIAESGTHHFYRNLGFAEIPGALSMLKQRSTSEEMA